MKPRVTILGASARAAAWSAVAAGYEPYAVDLFADRDLTAVCEAVRINDYPHDFSAALAAAPESPWIYTGGLENYPRLIERLAATRPLWGNRGAGLGAIRSPARLAATVEKAGLHFPETLQTLPASGLSKPMGDPAAQWLIKPQHSSGGLGIRFAGPDDADRELRHSFYQRYIAGEAASALFVAARAKATLLGCSRQILGCEIGMEERPFLYAGSIAPLGLSDEQTAKLATFANLLAAEFGLVGFVGVDFVIGEGDELWIVEVNPRYTASAEVVERATGTNLFLLHTAACESGSLPVDAPKTPARHAGKRVVYARQDCSVPAVFDEIVSDWNRQMPAIADLPRIGDRIPAGQPVVTVICDGESAGEVEQSLRQRSSTIESLLTSDF